MVITELSAALLTATSATVALLCGAEMIKLSQYLLILTSDWKDQ